MSENILNNLNTGLNKPFGFNIIPERTMQQVKESALNLLKDVVKPITDIGVGKEEVLDGTLSKKIKSYQNIINSVNNNMSAIDQNSYRTLDIKT